MTEFLAMGGYAAYVWLAYGIAFGVIAGLFARSWRLLKAAEKAEQALGKRSHWRARLRVKEPA